MADPIIATVPIWPPVGYVLTGSTVTLPVKATRTGLRAEYGYNPEGSVQHLHHTQTAGNVTVVELAYEPLPNSLIIFETTST